ncbi:MAG: hypothetical protein ACI4D5_02920 [Kineothrix sp.]
MNDFRGCYRSAVQDMDRVGMKEIHIDARGCMDRRRHRRRVAKRLQRAAVTVSSVIGILFVCGYGTVKAGTYIGNAIKVREWGFASGDLASMEENAPEQMTEESGTAELKVCPPMEEAFRIEEEAPVKHYSSIEEFENSEDILFPQPSMEMEGTVEIAVCGEWAMIRYDMGSRTLWLERTNYAHTRGHAAAKVFPEGVCNERTYTNAQGYTYTLVDSVRAEGEETLRIHGAATAGTYEIFIDFSGYTEEEARQVMDSIDLSLYEGAE